MKKLITPFGEISLTFDGQPIEYNAVELEKLEVLCPDVDGRYKIAFDFLSDNSSHILSCFLDVSEENIEIGVESGERLEALAFYKNDIKLTIGAEGESGYINLGYDYDIDYLKNGISYRIMPSTKSNTFIFGISWISPCTDENDHYTWYGADPTLM